VKPLLRDKEVAHLAALHGVRCSLSTLRHARADRPALRTPPFERQGGRIVYRREDLIKFFKSLGVEL
jgi:hypothetical protein